MKNEQSGTLLGPIYYVTQDGEITAGHYIPNQTQKPMEEVAFSYMVGLNGGLPAVST